MNKKNLKKAGVGLLISALAIGSASAFLSTTKTSVGTTNITSGKFQIVFENQQNTITLKDSHPMNKEWAETHLQSYSFNIANKSGVKTKYKLTAHVDEGAINPSLIRLSLYRNGKPEAYCFTIPEFNEKVAHFILNSDSKDTYTLYAYIDEKATNEVTSQSVKFHLEVNAEQIEEDLLHVDYVNDNLVVKTNNYVAGGLGDASFPIPEGWEGVDPFVKVMPNHLDGETVVVKVKKATTPQPEQPVTKTSTLSENWNQSGAKTTIKTINITKTAPETHDKEWDASQAHDNSIKGYLVGTDRIDLVFDGTVALPQDSSFLFSNYRALETITGLETVDTSNVTNMNGMFNYAGQNTTTWNIGDLSRWDVSKVTDMNGMFNGAGLNATTWNIGDLSNWNVSNVTDMNAMFGLAGQNATTWNIGDLSKWNVSNVTNVGYMFCSAGEKATPFTLDLSGWDASKVTDMSFIFNSTGANKIMLPKNISYSANITGITDKTWYDITDGNKEYNQTIPTGNSTSHTLVDSIS